MCIHEFHCVGLHQKACVSSHPLILRRQLQPARVKFFVPAYLPAPATTLEALPAMESRGEGYANSSNTAVYRGSVG